ncbi:MAG: hypothetical protein NWR72_08850 [Bacteroidia bacterium]|nr:hypothetical protein [Bacteroidia bacterium]
MQRKPRKKQDYPCNPMLLFKAHFILSIFTFLATNSALSQERDIEWQVAYFAPYLSNIGGSLGRTFTLKELGENAKERRKSQQRLQLLTQCSYFTQSNVSQNLVLNPELVYRLNKSDKRFFFTSSVGAGYLLAFQRQDGSLNLGTGEIDYRYDAINYFLPSLNIGLGIDPKKYLGLFIKATYGGKLSVQNTNAAFFAISTGLMLRLHSKK